MFLVYDSGRGERKQIFNLRKRCKF